MFPGSDVGSGIVYRRPTPRRATESWGGTIRKMPDSLQKRLLHISSQMFPILDIHPSRRNSRASNGLSIREVELLARTNPNDVRHLEDMSRVSVSRHSEHRARELIGRGYHGRREPPQDGVDRLRNRVSHVVPASR